MKNLSGAHDFLKDLWGSLQYVFASSIFHISILISFSLFTHFFNLSEPQSIVFDEKYFVPIIHSYQEGEFFIDPHPPLGKLILTAGGVLAGNTEYLSKDYVEDHGYPSNYNITGNRVLPALFGVLLSPLIYLIVFELTRSKRIAFFTGTMMIFENALILQSKYTLFDSILLFFTFSSFLAGLYMISHSKNWKYFWLIISSVLAGCAMSTKMTGLGALGILFVMIVIWNKRRENWTFRWFFQLGLRSLLTLIIASTIYVSVFAVHFSLITKVGKGIDEYSDEYRLSLQQSDGSAPTTQPSLFSNIIEFHEGSIRYENGVPPLDLNKPEGEIGSAPITWPVMSRAIPYYWRRETADQTHYAFIYLIGNPVVWYLGLFGAIVSLALFISSRFLNREFLPWHGILLLFAFLLNWVPTFFIKRVMYLYHYLIPLTFSLILFAILMKIFLRYREKNKQGKVFRWFLKHKNISLSLAILIVMVGFIVYAPFTYGITVSKTYFDSVNLFQVWNLKYLIIK